MFPAQTHACESCVLYLAVSPELPFAVLHKHIPSTFISDNTDIREIRKSVIYFHFLFNHASVLYLHT